MTGLIINEQMLAPNVAETVPGSRNFCESKKKKQKT